VLRVLGAVVALAGAAGCRDLELPEEGADGGGAPVGVTAALLEPQATGPVPQRTRVVLEVEAPRGVAEVELSCPGGVLAQWRGAEGPSDGGGAGGALRLEREVDLGPCRPAGQQGAGAAPVALSVTAVDGTRVLSRHGPFERQVLFAAPVDAPVTAEGPLSVRMPAQLGPRMPLEVEVVSFTPLAGAPRVVAGDVPLEVVAAPAGEAGAWRFLARLPGGLTMPEVREGESEPLEVTVLVQVGARAVDGTRLQSVGPVRLARVLWERLLPAPISNGELLRSDTLQGAMAPLAVDGGLVLALATAGGPWPQRLDAETGTARPLQPGTDGGSPGVIGFDGLGAVLRTGPDGGAPFPVPNVSFARWDRAGERVCYDTLAPGAGCRAYQLVCAETDGGIGAVDTGVRLSAVPSVRVTSGDRALRTGVASTDPCCPGCADTVFVGAPAPLRALSAPGLSAGRSTAQGLREASFLLTGTSPVSLLAADGGLSPLPAYGATQSLPLVPVGPDRLLYYEAAAGGAGELQLRDAAGAGPLARLPLPLNVVLEPDAFGPAHAEAVLPDGSGVVAFRQALPGSTTQQQLVVVGFGPGLRGSWVYRPPFVLTAGDPIAFAAEPGGRRVYLLELNGGRVVALAR
jgi:hypothetical protein